MFYSRSMAKKSKKRTKRYHGEDARTISPSSQPVVHRYEAVERTALQQWWHEKKRIVKVSTLGGGGLLILFWLLFELFNIMF